MPNWVENILIVCGPPKEVDRFCEETATGEKPLTFAAHVPEPSYAEATSSADALVRVKDAGMPDSIQVVARGWDATAEGSSSADEVFELSLKDGRLLPQWYAWRLQNWGCKRDASFEGTGPGLVARGHGVAVFCFETPWAPPAVWLGTVARLFARCAFQLHAVDRQCPAASWYRFENGGLREGADLDVGDLYMQDP